MGQVEKRIVESGLTFRNKKVKHTPAPWECRKTKKGYAILHPLINKEGEYKGKLGGYHVVVQERQLSPEGIETKLTEANARLIASAPELLEALQEFVRLNELRGWMVETHATVTSAKLAIQKAIK